MRIRPTNDNIVLKLPEIKKEEITKGGIIVPTSGTQQSLRKDIAEVIAVGEGRRLNNGTLLPLSVKAGDTIMFNKFAGTEVETQEGKFLIIKDSDILAVIE